MAHKYDDSKRDALIVKNKELLLVALRNSNGNVTNACDEVGITRRTFYNYINNDIEFAQEVEDLDDRNIDFVENIMFDRISQGSDKLIEFYLKTKGKKKGYGQTIDVTSNGANIMPTVVNVILGKKKPEELED